MAIKFPSKPLKLTNLRQYEKKDEDGNMVKILHFAKFGDEEALESQEFILPTEIDPSTLKLNARYNVGIEIDGKWTRLYIAPSEQVKLGRTQAE